jgi:hypothetical protein
LRIKEQEKHLTLNEHDDDDDDDIKVVMVSRNLKIHLMIVGNTSLRVYGDIIGLQPAYYDSIRPQPIQGVTGVQSTYDDSTCLYPNNRRSSVFKQSGDPPYNYC